MLSHTSFLKNLLYYLIHHLLQNYIVVSYIISYRSTLLSHTSFLIEVPCYIVHHFLQMYSTLSCYLLQKYSASFLIKVPCYLIRHFFVLKTLITENGGVMPLVALLDLDMEDVLINTVNAIRVLCSGNPANQKAVAECRGLDPLVEFLDVSSGKETES